MTKYDLNKGDKIYYARIMPKLEKYDLCELTIRTIQDNYFVGIDNHDKHAYLFSYNSFGNTIFTNREDCLYKIRFEEEKYLN